MPTTLLSLRFPRFDPAPAAMVIVANSSLRSLPLGRLARLKSSSASGGAPARSLERMATASSIRCRAQYTEAKEGLALNESIVCASESFKLDITSYVEASGEGVQGYWKEASRDVSGHVTGRISAGRFEGELSAATFSAGISLTSNGRAQAVSIQPSGGDVSDVHIELKRSG